MRSFFSRETSVAVSKFDIQNVLTRMWGPRGHFGRQFDQKSHFLAISSSYMSLLPMKTSKYQRFSEKMTFFWGGRSSTHVWTFITRWTHKADRSIRIQYFMYNLAFCHYWMIPCTFDFRMPAHSIFECLHIRFLNVCTFDFRMFERFHGSIECFYQH